MSFVDLATLAQHKRHEMEGRIEGFSDKCDTVIQQLINLQSKAYSFLDELNCDPSELRERFLNCMNELDEYQYLVTEFHLALNKLEEDTEYTPEHDSPRPVSPAPVDDTTYNLLDALSEPTPSTSKTCNNLCPAEKPLKKKVPKEEQLLISFSSESSSSEAEPTTETATVKKPARKSELEEDLKNLRIASVEENPHRQASIVEQRNLPAQTILQVDGVYPATLMHVDGSSFWLITDPIDDVYTLMMDMTAYYKKIVRHLSLQHVMSLTYCAQYDEESDCFYRGLFVKVSEEDLSIAEVFLVDTGEVTTAAINNIQPLVPIFAKKPPFARCCHLAGVDLNISEDRDIMKKQEEFLKTYIGTMCHIQVDDNSSESLGVYIILQSGECLNNLLVDQGLAFSVRDNDDEPEGAVAVAAVAAVATVATVAAEELPPPGVAAGPEHSDPVEAVTGHSNRDESDICKYYKGGTEKTCFKGSKCKKRHIRPHPEGWTLDRYAVAGRCRPLPLPQPSTFARGRASHVAHFDRFFMHIDDTTQRAGPELPIFGVIRPPMTLEALVTDMNSPATHAAYKPLKTIPAPGEIVAAVYPPDNKWYRARVLTVTRADQNVEVMFIDYGNVMWVREDALAELCARHAALPAQAVRCALAGVRALSADSAAWARARAQLEALLLGRTLHVRVIARDYDEITVEVFLSSGHNVGEQLVARNKHLDLVRYSIQWDDREQEIYVP